MKHSVKVLKRSENYRGFFDAVYAQGGIFHGKCFGYAKIFIIHFLELILSISIISVNYYYTKLFSYFIFIHGISTCPPSPHYSSI